MTIERDFREMMDEVVVFTSASAVDKYGKQVYSPSASASYYARIMYGQRMIRDNDGREVVEAGRAILYGVAASVTTISQIRLPDGRTPKINYVSTVNDEDGPHHTTVSFGQG